MSRRPLGSAVIVAEPRLTRSRRPFVPPESLKSIVAKPVFDSLPSSSSTIRPPVITTPNESTEALKLTSGTLAFAATWADVLSVSRKIFGASGSVQSMPIAALTVTFVVNDTLALPLASTRPPSDLPADPSRSMLTGSPSVVYSAKVSGSSIFSTGPSIVNDDFGLPGRSSRALSIASFSALRPEAGFFCTLSTISATLPPAWMMSDSDRFTPGSFLLSAGTSLPALSRKAMTALIASTTLPAERPRNFCSCLR